jgi:hypothetical protein
MVAFSKVEAPSNAPSDARTDDLPRSGLYDGLVLDVHSKGASVFQYVNKQLNPDQRAIFAHLRAYGMINKTGLLTGIGGSGKSHLLRACGAPFIGGRVTTSNFRNVRRNIELARLRLDKETREDIEIAEAETTVYKKPDPVQLDRTQPAFIQPTDAHYDPNGTIEEKARLLYVAATDKAADALYTAVRRDALKFAELVSRDVPLIYRRHSKAEEMATAKALLEPEDPNFYHEIPGFDPSIPVRGISKAICREFEKFSREMEGIITDNLRFKGRTASMAYYAVNLSLPDQEQAPEIRAAFSEQERDIIRSELQIFHQVSSRLKVHGEWTGNMTSMIENACKYAFNWLDLKADVVITTINTAARKKFALHRQPHFLAVDDLGRLDDIDIMPFYGLYPTTHARVFAGDHRQLGVVKRFSHGPTKPSFLTKLRSNGFEALDLRNTQRFGNEELHDLVRIINKDTSIQMWKSALRDEDTARVRNVHMTIFPQLKAFTATLYLDYPESEKYCRPSGGDEVYNTRTATVSINFVQKLITHGIDGSQIVLTSAYSSQTELHEELFEAAARTATRNQAHQLLSVRCSTLDSFMNEESFYHVHDTCSHTALVYDEVPRAVVLYSRAQVGFTFIGSNTSLMNKRFDNKHPCKLAVRSMVNSKRYVTLTPAYISKVNQFTDITRE